MTASNLSGIYIHNKRDFENVFKVKYVNRLVVWIVDKFRGLLYYGKEARINRFFSGAELLVKPLKEKFDIVLRWRKKMSYSV